MELEVEDSSVENKNNALLLGSTKCSEIADKPEYTDQLIIEPVTSSDDLQSAKPIQAIDRGTVHRICSGQVVLTLATAVKELVENSIDAGASIVDIKLKEYGSIMVEVSDNGSGVKEDNFAGLTLKHHTSKLQDFSDLINVETFGFRGEALSSLCALSDLSVVTRHKDADVGTKLEFNQQGKITSQLHQARQKGTTVLLQNLFYTLPVRHKEFQRNLKKEFTKMVQVLNSYCIISSGVKITCTNQTAKGNRSTVLSTKGNPSIRENIANVFGPKQVQSLLEFKQVDPNEDVCEEYGLKVHDVFLKIFRINGFISKCEHGQGRSSTDRQFYFINKRPCDSVKLVKVINDVYHQYNRHQYPFVVLDITIDRESVDVNVTPDKRKIFVENEKILLAIIKMSLVLMFEPTTSVYQVNVPVFKSNSGSLQSQASVAVHQENNRIPDNRSVSGPPKESIVGTLARLKRSFSSAFAKEEEPPLTRKSLSTPSPIRNSKQRKLDTFVSKRDETRETSITIPVLDISQNDDNAELASCSPQNDDNAELTRNSQTDEKSSITDNAQSSVIFIDSVENSISSSRMENISSCSTPPKDTQSEPKNISEAVSETSDLMLCRDPELTVEQGDNNSGSEVPWKLGESCMSDTSTLKSDCDVKISNASACPERLEEADEIPGVSGTQGDTDTEYNVTVTEYDQKQEVLKKAKPLKFSLSSLKNKFMNRKSLNKDSAFCRRFRATISPDTNQAAENELKKEIKKEMFADMQVLGQFNLGFIITKFGQDLFIVDQHASDEKYNFEMLQKHTVIQCQRLIQPQTLELTACNESILMDNLEVFKKNGFDFLIDEKAAPMQRAKLVSTPVSKNWHFGKEDIEELIFMLTDSPGTLCRPSRVRQMFASRACRKSIMIGTALNKAEMKKVLCHMGDIEQPWNCPHGRPTMRHLINLDMIPR